MITANFQLVGLFLIWKMYFKILFLSFNSGNNESLKEIPYAKGIDVRQELLSFHERWYSANIMSLVVLGKGLPHMC